MRCRTLLDALVRSPTALPKRHLNVHEYVGLTVLRDAGVNVPRFGVASTTEEALKVASTELKGISDYVVKAQVLAGGRGKGTFDSGLKGGVKIVYSPAEVQDIAKQMLGNRLVTKQTTAQGVPCNQVMISERLYPRREYYFAIMMEREYGVRYCILEIPFCGTNDDSCRARLSSRRLKVV